MGGISNVGNNYNNQTTQVQNQGSANAQKNANEAAGKNEPNTIVAEDEYAGSAASAKTGNYNKNGKLDKIDKEYMDSAKANWKNNTGAFQKMVEGMNKTGNSGRANTNFNSKDAGYWSDWVKNQLGQQYSVDEAKALVADDGYWGVDKTSERIVDMAKSLSGGDMSKYEELLGAIKKGFGAAANEWGGKMPDITKKTYDAVMEKMEAWKNSADTSNTQTQDAVEATGAME